MLNVRVRVQGIDDSLAEGMKQYIQRLRVDGFYGVLEIQFNEGDIVLVRKQETLKPSAFLAVE